MHFHAAWFCSSSRSHKLPRPRGRRSLRKHFKLFSRRRVAQLATTFIYNGLTRMQTRLRRLRLRPLPTTTLLRGDGTKASSQSLEHWDVVLQSGDDRDCHQLYVLIMMTMVVIVNHHRQHPHYHLCHHHPHAAHHQLTIDSNATITGPSAPSCPLP